MTVSRRNFIKRTALFSVAVPFFVPESVFGAGEEIRIGIVGMGVRGRGTHLPAFSGLKNVKVVAVVDPDKTRTAASVKWAADKGLTHKIDQYEDMRAMYDRKDIQAVSVATMNYWHGLATIWACEAGKDVFCEKPLSHFLWEGRQMVNAARKYDRVVQHGTQQMACKSIHEMKAWIEAGNLGKIKNITMYCNKPRNPIGNRKEPLPLPPDFNYDLWCGPAQDGPLYRDRLQYDCSFTWNMGDAESLNQGVHQAAIARFMLDIEDMPRRVISFGGRFLFNDVGDVPNTQMIYYDYPGKPPILYEVHNLRAGKDSKAAGNYKGSGTGLSVECEGGYVLIEHGPNSRACDKDGKILQTWKTVDPIFQNFIDVVRSRRKEELFADVLSGHYSTRMGHAANISYRLGEKASVSAQKKAIEDYPYLVEMHDRYLKHIAAHDIDPDETILGPWLECDTEKERVGNSEAAAKLVRGTYRAPYVVREIS